jgi:recombination protein RecA
MSIKNLLRKTVTDLTAKKGFSFNLGTPHTADQHGVADVPAWIPSGITMLDHALGGGLPLGRISELFSENESEGKSTLIQHFMVQTQRGGGLVVLLDSEAATDKDRAARMGLDLSKTLIFGPPTVEDGFLFIDQLIRNIAEDKDLMGAPTLIVWDTINAAPTRGEKASDPFADGMVVKPRIIAAALRNYVGEFYKYKVHMCLVNQSITNIDRGNPYAPKTMTPGGKAIKFYSSLRVKCKKTGFIGEPRTLEKDDQRLGISVKVEAVKNKLALPFRAAELYLYGETGYDDIMSMANYFLGNKNTDLLAQKGGRYYLSNGKCPFWKDVRAEVLADPKVLSSWQAKVAELFPLPPNRERNPETGWITRKEGCRVVETEETEEAPE